MTFPASLRVSAIVAAVTLLGVACGDDGMGASGLSGNTPSMGSESGSFGSSVSSSGDAVTAAETTETPTGSSSSSSSGATTIDPTTGDPTTGPATTTTGPDLTTSGTTDAPNTTSGGAAVCGDGMIEGMEQCDGANLNGFTCEALGNAGGTLQCDPVTCTFDTQLCEGGGGTSG